MLRPPPIIKLGDDSDELFQKAVEEVTQYERASASLLQRRLSIGYARAVRLIDQLEAAGVVGPAEGSKPREVLISSVDELLGSENGGKKPDKEEDPFQLPTNYKVPTNVALTREDKVPWGKQFIDVFEPNTLRDSKVEFPIPVGFAEEKLQLESLLDTGNMIIAGNPLSQKENFADTLLLTYLLLYEPKDLRIILNDERHYLDLYNGISHLLSPVINEHDKIISALRWAQAEMDGRLKLFAQAGVRNISSYNGLSGVQKLAHILIITFYNFPDIETEDSLTTLSGQGVRAGIHNIVMVDRTNSQSLPSTIKNNIPARLVFRLTSVGESKAIDVTGAEKLQPGQIIHKPNFERQVSLKGIYTPERNVKEVIEAVKESLNHG